MTDEQKTEFIRQLLIGKRKGGHLELWGPHYLHPNRYSGIVTDDPSDRFDDGSSIHTSPCIKIHTINDQKFLETEQSYYTLGEEGTWDDRERYKEYGDEYE